MITKLDIKDFIPTASHTIYDVRDAKSYNDGHIEHAKNAPLDTINQDLLNASTGDIYVLCGGGTKAERACDLLHSLNPTRHIIHLTGGTRGAKALGMTIVCENTDKHTDDINNEPRQQDKS